MRYFSNGRPFPFLFPVFPLFSYSLRSFLFSSEIFDICATSIVFSNIYSSTYEIALSIISLVEDFQFYQVVSSRDREFKFWREWKTTFRQKFQRLKILKIHRVSSVDITLRYFIIQYFQRKRLIYDFLSSEKGDTNEIGKLIAQWTAASLAEKRFRICTWAISRESYSSSRSEGTFADAAKEKPGLRKFPIAAKLSWLKEVCVSKPKKPIWDSRPFRRWNAKRSGE